MLIYMPSVRDNIIQIEERIHNACVRAGRERSSLRLMVVSKLQPVEKIREALEYGCRLFGESRVQETRDRRDIFPDDAEIHMIGHLQRNKTRDAAQLYHGVHSLDAVKTVDALERHLADRPEPLEVMIEMNTSGEASKHGVATFDEVTALAERIESSDRFRLTGLMTIGPFGAPSDDIRSAFALLRESRDRLERLMGTQYPELSMGMTDDMEEAVLEGSTMLRIGTAIFGRRPT